MNRAMFVSIAAAALGGCNVSGGGFSPAESEAQLGRTVTITRHVTYRTEDGRAETSPDRRASELDVTLFVPLDDGSFSIRTAPPSADAVWTFPAVPDGEVVVRVDGPRFVTQVFATRADALDLGWTEVGRADRVDAVAAVPLALRVSGAAPFEPDDQFELYAADLNAWDIVPSEGAALAAGATGGVLSYDWFFSLLAPSDVLRIAQYRLRPFASGTVRTVAAAGAVSGLRTVSGAPSSAAFTLVPVSTSATLPLDWRLGAFEDALGGPPTPGTVTHELSLLAMPGEPGLAAASMNLVDVALPGGFGAGPLEPIEYGRFLPAPYREWTWAMSRRDAPRLAPGASIPWIASAIVAREDALDGGRAPTLAPVLWPPRWPTLDGRPATSPQGAVGATPVLSWDPPLLGTPTDYQVSLVELENHGGETWEWWRARIFTTERAVRLPPGLLEPGRAYVAEIRARWTAEPVANAPLRAPLPRAAASIVTEPFYP